jgi:hypothetical protein
MCLFICEKSWPNFLNEMKNRHPAQRDGAKSINLSKSAYHIYLSATGRQGTTRNSFVCLFFAPIPRPYIRSRELRRIKRKMGPSLVLSSTTTMADWNRGNATAPFTNSNSSNEEDEEEEEGYHRQILSTSTTTRWLEADVPDVSGLYHLPTGPAIASAPFVLAPFHTQSGFDPDPYIGRDRQAAPPVYNRTPYDISASSPAGDSYEGPEYTMSPLYSSSTTETSGKPLPDDDVAISVAVAKDKDHGNADAKVDDDDRKPPAVTLVQILSDPHLGYHPSFHQVKQYQLTIDS